MAEEEKDKAVLEEERLLKTLSGARNRAHNAFGAAAQGKNFHAHTPSKPQVAHKPQVALASKPASGGDGQVPEWKRRQQEASAARAQQEEDDRRKKQDQLKEMKDVMSGASAASQQVSQAARSEPKPAAHAKVEEAPVSVKASGATSLSKEEEDERSRKEEEYLLRRTGTAQREASRAPAANTLTKPQTAYKPQTAVATQRPPEEAPADNVRE